MDKKDLQVENKSLKEALAKGEQSKARSQMLSPEAYGIKILSPEDEKYVENEFEVNGTYTNLPDGQSIWIVTFNHYENGKTLYWPQKEAAIRNNNWYGNVRNLGGESGDKRRFSVMVVGPSGKALFKYYGQVGIKTRWQGISELPPDIVECAKPTVNRK